MDPHRFVLPPRDEETLQELICAICACIAVSPTNCRHDHVFCYSCIHTYLNNEPRCPVDHALLHPAELSANRFMDRTISRLTIRCENRDAGGARAMIGAIRKRMRHPLGCRWEGPVNLMEEHQRQCPFRCVECQVCKRDDIPLMGMQAHLQVCAERYANCENCEKPVILREMPQHVDVCPMATVFCPNHCLVRANHTTDVTVLRREDIPAHLPHCPGQVVACEFSDLGCKFRGRRDTMHHHMQDSLQSHVKAVRLGLLEVRSVLGLSRMLTPHEDSMSPSPPKGAESNTMLAQTHRRLDPFSFDPLGHT